jgi:Caspase domain
MQPSHRGSAYALGTAHATAEAETTGELSRFLPQRGKGEKVCARVAVSLLPSSGQLRLHTFDQYLGAASISNIDKQRVAAARKLEQLRYTFGLGFEVAVERDTGLGALTRAVNAYTRRLQAAGPNAVGFFYYSGHGA